MGGGKHRRAIYIWIAFGIASIATIFDAISSWQIIELNPIAIEGNPIWNFIGSSLGFAGTMILRAMVGIFFLGILLFVSFRSKMERVRALAAFGIYLSASVLLALSAYHIWFRLFYG